MGISPGFAQWKLSFGISPIIFVGGIAQNMPGGQLPIISITDAGSFSGGPLGQFTGFGINLGISANVNIGGVDIGIGASVGVGDSGLDVFDQGLDGYFAYFEPLAGGTLQDFEYGHYPFANQSVAANAVVQEPLVVSMLMVCPVKGTESWDEHLSIITSLQNAMAQHAALGGTYLVATPKFIYTNCLLTRMSDVTSGDSKQPQSKFQLDFEQPLITLQQAQEAQNGLMSKMTSGTMLEGTPGSASQALSSLVNGLPFNVSPSDALSVLSSGVSSFNATALISAVLPGGATMAAALGALSDVLPVSISVDAGLQILAGVVPTGIDPSLIPELFDTLSVSGISSFDASILLDGILPGQVSPAFIADSLVSALPATMAMSAGLSLLSTANVPIEGIPLSGGVAMLGQPLTMATPPTIPAAGAVLAAGIATAGGGAFAGVTVGATLPLLGTVSVSVGASG